MWIYMVTVLLVSFKWAGYDVRIEQAPDQFSAIVSFYKNDSLVKSFPTDGGYDFDKDFYTEDLDGDSVPELIVEVYTGGAHCCYEYVIFTSKPKLQYVGTLNTGMSSPDIENGEIICGYDFNYFDNLPVETTPPGIIMVYGVKKGKIVDITTKEHRLQSMDADLEELKKLIKKKSDYNEIKSYAASYYAEALQIGKEKEAYETLLKIDPKLAQWVKKYRNDLIPPENKNIIPDVESNEEYEY